MFIRAPYNYDVDAASDEASLGDMGPTLTKQSFAEEVDINTIVKRFNLTGQLPEDVRMPTYADFEGIFTFQDAMDAIVSARESFDAMPAAVRLRFNNDPARFVDFCSDPSNLEEARKLGLAVPEAAPVKAEPPEAAAPTVAPGAAAAASSPGST